MAAPKTPRYQTRILGGSTRSEIGWAITWAKQKLFALARQLKPGQSRRYHYHTNFKGVKSIELFFNAFDDLWLVTFRTDPTPETFLTLLRNRLDPEVVPRIGLSPVPIHVTSIALSPEGDPINAVGGGAIGPGLLIEELVLTPDSTDSVATDYADTLREVALQGQSVPLLATLDATGFLDNMIFNLPSSLITLGYPEIFTGAVDPIYYEAATDTLTCVMSGGDIEEIVDPFAQTGGGTANNSNAGQSIMFSMTLQDLLDAEPDADGFAQTTHTNVPSGSTVTISWNGFLITTAAVPLVDGDFGLFFNDVSHVAVNGLPLEFQTTITGTVVSGVASLVTVVLSQARTVGDSVTLVGRKDFAVEFPAVVDDLRPGISGQLGIATENIGLSFLAGASPTVQRFLTGAMSLVPPDGSGGFNLTSTGGAVNGVPLDPVTLASYKYGTDLSIRSVFTPANTLGLSDYETVSAQNSGISKTTQMTYGVYEGVYISYRESVTEQGSYTSNSLLSPSPAAGYQETTVDHTLLRIRFSNGIGVFFVVPDAATGTTQGGTVFNPAGDGTISNPSMAFNVPYRSGTTVNLGTGAGLPYTNPPDFADTLSPGSHTLFQAMKTSLNLDIVTPTAGISSGVLFDPITQFGVVADRVVTPNRFYLMNTSGDIVTVQKGPFPSVDFSEFVVGGIGGSHQIIRSTNINGIVSNDSSWTTQPLYGVGGGVGWGQGFSAGAFKLLDSFISASDAGLPRSVPFHIIWIVNSSVAGVFMGAAIDLNVFRTARAAWEDAKVAGADDATILALRNAVIAQLNIFFNNFASDELIAAASWPFINSATADILIVQE